jgi:hypothetical protein
MQPPATELIMVFDRQQAYWITKGMKVQACT